MRKKTVLLIGIIIIPILILFADHFILQEDLQVSASYDQSQAWKYIYNHRDEYPQSLLKLALHNKETIPFVYDYPNKHNQKTIMTLTQ